MALVINSVIPHSSGDELKKIGTVALDSSYPNGGYTLDPASFGLSYISKATFYTSTTANFIFEVDLTSTTRKLKVFQAFNYDTHTHSVSTSGQQTLAVVANVATLTFFATWPNFVVATAGGVTDPCTIIPSWAGAPATTQAAFNIGLKTLTFNAGDAVTSCDVDYTLIATSGDGAGNSYLQQIANATDLSAYTVVNYEIYGH